MFSVASWSSRKEKGKFVLFGFVFDIIVLFKLPLECKEIKPVNPKGNQPWIFTGKTDAETPVLPPPDANSWLTGKDPDAGKDWGQEKEVTENEVAGCITDSMDVSLSEYQEIVKDREPGVRWVIWLQRAGHE